jgi:hypothetical protein
MIVEASGFAIVGDWVINTEISDAPPSSPLVSERRAAVANTGADHRTRTAHRLRRRQPRGAVQAVGDRLAAAVSTNRALVVKEQWELSAGGRRTCPWTVTNASR